MQQKLSEAVRLFESGDLVAAEALCKQILKSNKRVVDARQLLGLIAFRREDWETAIRFYKQCIAHNSREPRFHYLLAKTYTASGMLDKAIKKFDDALKVKADFQSALIWKAIVLERQGSFDEAHQLLEPMVEAGSLTPEIAEVYGKLELRAERVESALAIIEQELAKPKSNSVSHNVLRFLKGRALEATGDYPQAFAAYTAANNGLGASFSAQEYIATIDRTIEVFSSEAMQRLPRAGVNGEQAIFIAGMPRSGTTLVEQIIDAHPEAFGAGEIKNLEHLTTPTTSGTETATPYPDSVADFEQVDVDRLAQRYLAEVTAIAKGAARVVNKSLENYKLLGLIAILFPQARVIHCQRNRLDTCLSCYFNYLMPPRHAYAADLRHIALVYKQYQRLMRHWHAVSGVQILDLSYESLVANPEKESRRIIEFCGLDWHSKCLNPHRSKRVPGTLSYEQVRKPINDSAIGRWRNYERQLEVLRPATGFSSEPGDRKT